MLRMRRIYDVSLLLLFAGVLIAGAGLGTKSELVFRIGAVPVLVGVIGVLVYAFRPKHRE